MIRRITLLGIFIGLVTACSNGTSFGVGEKEENFDSSVLYNNKVDIVWVVDDSSSMAQHQQKLSEAIPEMLNQLNALKMDYRMVVTTTSVGNGFSGGAYFGEPKILTASTPNLVNVLKDRLLRGQMGSQFERGILSLQNMLSPEYISAQGAGFHRDEALLLVNILSDDNDETDGTDDSVLQTLKNRLNTLKKPFRPNVGGWMVNYIGAVNNQCQDNLGDVKNGGRYINLVNASGGKAYPICTTSLAEAVKGLQARVLEIITDYPLTKIPAVDTIKVYKNNVVVPRSTTNGWDYIPSSNVIRFFGAAIPAVDSPIRVEFTPASAG